MKYNIEPPFFPRWQNGYLVMDNEGRRRIVLYNNHDDISGVTYARYLMCVKLGYILPTELEVDHIDDDKTNDDINNLQILTREQNILKQSLYRLSKKAVYGFDCAYCDTSFLMTEADVKYKLSTSKTGLVFCSQSCSRTYMGLMNPPTKRTVTEEDISHIRHLRQCGLSSYQISEQLGLARNTIMKYWN